MEVVDKTKQFIEQARDVHGDKYDYSKTVYVKNTEKVCIICPVHGEFLQTPKNHKRGHGCYLCGIETSAIKADTTRRANRELLLNRLPEGDWDYQKCYNIAASFVLFTDYATKEPESYTVARINGWLNDYTWFVDGRDVASENRRVYDYQECYQRAQQYSTIKEFEENDKGACVAARRNGWVNDYTWFTRLWERKWDRESCYLEAQKFQSLAAFASESSSCYSTAVNNHWLDEYTWLERKRVKPGTWQVYENCYNEALKYKSRTELQDKSPGCYEGARENGWLDEFTWLEKPSRKKKRGL